MMQDSWKDVICPACDNRSEFHCDDDGLGGYSPVVEICDFSKGEVLFNELNKLFGLHVLCSEELVILTKKLTEWANKNYSFAEYTYDDAQQQILDIIENNTEYEGHY